MEVVPAAPTACLVEGCAFSKAQLPLARTWLHTWDTSPSPSPFALALALVAQANLCTYIHCVLRSQVRGGAGLAAGRRCMPHHMARTPAHSRRKRLKLASCMLKRAMRLLTYVEAYRKRKGAFGMGCFRAFRCYTLQCPVGDWALRTREGTGGEGWGAG